MLSTVLLFALLLVPVILAAAGVRTLFPASRDCRTLPWKAWLDRTLMVVRLASLAMIVLLAIWMLLALANFEIFTWDPSLFM